MRAYNAIRVSLPRGSYESLPVLVDKCFERRRRPTTNRFDQVVRAGEDPVLVVDGCRDGWGSKSETCICANMSVYTRMSRAVMAFTAGK